MDELKIKLLNLWGIAQCFGVENGVENTDEVEIGVVVVLIVEVNGDDGGERLVLTPPTRQGLTCNPQLGNLQ